MESESILEKIKYFFTKDDKAILNVCNTFSKKFKINVLYIRLFFIISFIFPLGFISIILYLLLSINLKNQILYKLLFTIVGAILGLPLSYYFQPDMVQVKIGGINGYVQHFDQILESKDLVGNVVMGVVVFAIIGFVIGYFMDKNAVQKTN
ncbi:MAG: hypothetical protein WBA61_05020 [Aequorivita sp.]